jgi:hypothetical protein
MEEPSEEIFFRYSASLRIFGSIPDLDELSKRLGVSPTHTHRRGDRRSPDSQPYEHDMWIYEAPVPANEPIHVHIDRLWSVFKDRKHDLLQLKNQFALDVFLGYRSNSDSAGLEVPSTSLEMFIELQVPFGLSIIVT